jgi:hypothetical protein
MFMYITNQLHRFLMTKLAKPALPSLALTSAWMISSKTSDGKEIKGEGRGTSVEPCR